MRRLAMQLLAAEPRGVPVCPALLRSRKKSFLEQAIQRGHHRGIGQIPADAIHQFPYGGGASRPQYIKHASLERAKLSHWFSKGMEDPFHFLFILFPLNSAFYRERSMPQPFRIISAIGSFGGRKILGWETGIEPATVGPPPRGPAAYTFPP